MSSLRFPRQTWEGGVLPGDTQLPPGGQMGDVGHMAGQLCGLSCHLWAQDGLQVQHVARLWGGKEGQTNIQKLK